MEKTRYFCGHERKQFWDLLTDSAVEVMSVRFINEDKVLVTYREDNEFILELPTTNVVIASWVTAQARLKLYEYLEKLGDRVMYKDTGLFIFLICCFKYV